MSAEKTKYKKTEQNKVKWNKVVEFYRASSVE